MTNTLVYALFDPRTGHARYVGQSLRGMARPNEHLRRKVPDHNRTHCANWLRGLKASGAQPEIRVVEHTTEADLNEAEVYWIAYFRAQGCPLTNHQPGGDNHRADDSTRAKIAAANLGRKHSPETIATLSADRIGAGNPMFARAVSQATRDKRAVSMSGERNHRFGLPPVGGHATRFVKGHVTWHAGKKLPERSGENHPMFGRSHTDASLQKMRESKKGSIPWNKGTGKPRTTPVREQRCSECTGLGHNKRTCTQKGVES